MAHYRLLAMQQAERAARGTLLHAPSDDPVARDLYACAEAAAVDAALVRAVPRLRDALAAARVAALAERPALDALRPAERAVELVVRRVLAAAPEDGVRALDAAVAGLTHGADAGTPTASRAWAAAAAVRVRAAGGRYRGAAPVALWGELRRSAVVPAPLVQEAARAAPDGTQVQIAVEGTRRPGEGGAGPDAGDAGPDVRPPDGSPDVLPNGAPPLAGRDAPAAANAAAVRALGSGAALPDPAAARPDHAPLDADAARADSSDAPCADAASTPPVPGIDYPEWDARAGRYRPQGATVRERMGAAGDPRWATGVLAEHGALVRRVRARFERLRARRARLPHQRDGDELDLAACVRALVDRRAGHAPDDRLYAATRPARRGLAIAVLADASGSTDAVVGPGERIVDVEKMALLLASEAFDALGDRYALFAFASRGAADVRVAVLKEFAERNGEAVRARVAGVAPGGNTRLGAALRHATARLAREPAGHRLLLILSDGRPNDMDGYVDTYAVADARRAVAEARAAGVVPFCLTVDREEGGEYLAAIFGAAGHTILRRPEQLPAALLALVRQLLARAVR